VFGPRLGGEAVWDDVYLVTENPLVRAANGAAGLLTRDLWGGATGAPTQLYHPVPMLTLWLQARASMALPWLRLGNLALHAGCGALLLAFLRRRLGVPPRLALFVALLFIVHPSTTEVAMWLTGRHDSVAVLCALGALLAWPAAGQGAQGAQAAPARPLPRVLGASALALLAFLSKEPYVVVPALLVLNDVRARLAGEPRASAAWLACPFAAVAVGFAIRAALGIPSSSALLGAAPLVHVQTYGTLLMHYGAQLVGLTNGLSTASYRAVALPAAIASAFGIAAAIAALAVAARRGAGARAGVAALGLAWFALALTPHVVSLPSIGMFGNRYGYFPAMGLAVALAAGLDAISVRAVASLARLRPVLAGAAVLLVLVIGIQTAAEASVWKDAESLFGADVERAPRDARALYHYAHAVTRKRGCAAAIPFYARAVEAEPTYGRAWHNLAGCLINEKRWPAAAGAAQNALTLAPDDPRAEYNLAIALLNAGRIPEGTSHLRRALELRPDYPAALAALAAVHALAAP
jgi:tetratricopeptide (TPR) repeat protein